MADDLKFPFDRPADAARTVALAHGAGAAMDSPFLTFFANGLGAQWIRVAQFEYPNMASQRVTGRTASIAAKSHHPAQHARASYRSRRHGLVHSVCQFTSTPAGGLGEFGQVACAPRDAQVNATREFGVNHTTVTS